MMASTGLSKNNVDICYKAQVLHLCERSTVTELSDCAKE
jgi:hypothetical protein